MGLKLYLVSEERQFIFLMSASRSTRKFSLIEKQLKIVVVNVAEVDAALVMKM